MQSSQLPNTIKSFSCLIHPHEEIQRVCLDLSTENSLQCIECILQTARKMPKDKFCQIADFVSFAAKQYKAVGGNPSFHDPPPSCLVDFLAYEENKITALTKNIEIEKQAVQKNFTLLLEEFKLLCQSKENEILDKLDMQLTLFKNNYHVYKSKIDKYYSQNNHEEFDQDSLLQRINQCKDTREMETLVKDLKEDIFKSSTATNDTQSKAEEIQADLKNFAQELNRDSHTIPRSSFGDSSSVKKVIQVAQKSLEEFSEIEEPITDIFGGNLHHDSKIITESQDSDLIRKWLRISAKNTQPRLLYRGSRDGFDAKTFHEKCDSAEETLTLIKSNFGNIFGGFSDQSWQGTYQYKTSNHCWLFSIDHREQYPIKKNSNTQAIYAHPSYGPTFGSGHDLLIDFSKANTGCYSQLGKAYDYNPENASLKPSRLAGAFQFVVKEIEVFAVYGRYSRSIDSGTLDSLVLKTKDLQLLQTWTSKLRNTDLELLYRGSRDGFDASTFHNYCDNQGPTLVLCKASKSGRVFGGYTSQNWSKSNQFVSDSQAFLFSINESTKHPIKGRDFAIYCSGETGPVFGKGYDLFIGANGEGTSALGMTYKANDTLGDLTKYLAGEAKFNLQEIEVFKVTKKRD